ncbi:MAG: RNA methyltransferase, partial [Bacteroidia bacterium]|nr:RNA methyltransferase [Bacteroidia bacterium]
HDYQARGIGGVFEPEGIADSIILRGKFFSCEMDSRSGDTGISAARDVREWAAITWKNYATGWTRGFHTYWMYGFRIADWFGIQQVICSTGCVDLFNPKVVQATMGSITRVNVNYVDLPGFLSSLEGEVPVYGMVLEGEDVFVADTAPHGIIVIGSESHGISDAVSEFITHRRSIPFYPANRENHAESLNAAVATGIVCAEFRRTREEGRRTRDEENEE